jgi:hypothetical protein
MWLTAMATSLDPPMASSFKISTAAKNAATCSGRGSRKLEEPELGAVSTQQLLDVPGKKSVTLPNRQSVTELDSMAKKLGVWEGGGGDGETVITGACEGALDGANKGAWNWEAWWAPIQDETRWVGPRAWWRASLWVSWLL